MARGFKRALSLLLALCMALGATVTAAAAEDGAAAGKVYETTGENLQDTIIQAINDGAEGATVKLTNDYTTTSPYIYVMTLKTLTIDLNNHKLTFKTPEPNKTSGKCESQGFWAYGTAVTVQNGSIISDSGKGAGADGPLATALFINNGGSIALEGVTVEGSAQIEKSGYAAVLFGGSLTVGKGSSLSSSKNAAVYGYGEGNNTVDISGAVTHTGTFSAVEGSYTSTGAMNVNVHDGAVIDGGDGAGILQMAPGSVTVDGGSITGATGIAMTKGNLTISGGEISGDGDYQEYKGSANYHVYDNGAAVYIEPVAAMKVTVSGGTLRSDKSYAFSAPKGGNLTLDIQNGAFIGGGGKGVLEAKGETGFVSGGTFSSPVDKDLLSDKLKFEAKKSGGDAPYSYHETEANAKKEAGTDGTVTDLATGEEIGGSGGDPSATYKIIIAVSSNGVVTASPTAAKKGDTVTLAIAPNSGYYLSAISTTPALTLSGSGNTRTFTMPASDVTVSSAFSSNSSASYLTGYVDIEGDPWVGETIYARVRNTNNTGTLRYQWTADGYDLYGETSRYLDLTRYEVGKVIRCVVTSSVQTGSISGRLWRTVDYYDSRYAPPNNSTNNNTSSGTNQNGTNKNENKNDNSFTIESPIFTTATNADGSKTTTVIEPDGSSGLIVLTSYGTVSSMSMTFSSDAFANALRTGRALALPTAVQSSRTADSAAPVRIVLPQSSFPVKVKIPVSQMTAGTVAVMENSFGPDTVVKSSVSESDGVLFELSASAVVKVVDNSKSFQDVPGGAWYANAVKWASSREVMNGVSNQRFDPQGTVNRAMMAQMLYNFDGAGSTGVVSKYSDVSPRNWYAASVSWAANNGIARDYGDRFGAEDALTREDMAHMLYNYARAAGRNPYASGNTVVFSDSGSVSDWARTAMQWAVGAGLINGTQNGTRAIVLDPQGTVTRAQLATIMQRFNNMP